MLVSATFTIALSLAALIGAETPSSVAMTFVSWSEGPELALTAKFSASEEHQGEKTFRYETSIWQSTSNDDKQPPQWSNQVNRFRAAPPLEGWPERKSVSLRWNSDQSVDLAFGEQARYRLQTEPIHLPKKAQHNEICCLWRSAKAQLFVNGQSRPGIALIEICEQGESSLTQRPKSMILAGHDQRAFVIHDERWFELSVDGDPKPLAEPPRLTWMEAVQTDRVLAPPALRVAFKDALLQLQRADFEPGRPGTGDWRDESSPVVLRGRGFRGEENFAATGIVFP